MKNLLLTSLITLFLSLSIPFSAHARKANLAGFLAPEAEIWGSANGFMVSPVKTGTSGCLKGKRYIEMKKDGVTLYAIFYHPVYDEPTALVSQVEFEFNPPAGGGQVQSYAVMIAPIMGTRGPTHTQSIKPDKSDACAPASGGKDKRWTEDWIREEHYGSGGRIQKLRLYNDYIR